MRLERRRRKERLLMSPAGSTQVKTWEAVCTVCLRFECEMLAVCTFVTNVLVTSTRDRASSSCSSVCIAMYPDWLEAWDRLQSCRPSTANK